MATRDFGCWPILFSLPSIFVHVVREMIRQASFPRPHKLHTAKEAMEVVLILTSEHGGTGAAFPYVQRALELEPQNIQAAKFMANWFTTSRKFSEALPYLRVAVQGAHPDSIYIVMLKETLAVLGTQAEARDADARGESR